MDIDVGSKEERQGTTSGRGQAGGRGACLVCNSAFHWANECPDKNNKSQLNFEQKKVNFEQESFNVEEVEIVEIDI